MAARFVVFVITLMVLTSAGGGVGTALATGDTGERLVVDADGNTDGTYTSIQAAVNAATAGDTISIRPGTYRERVTVATTVTLVAPDGASLNGTTLDDDSTGIKIKDDASVVLDGITLSGYTVGIDAGGTTGDWLLRNVTVRNTSYYAIRATFSTGDWRIQNGTIRNVGGAGVGAVKTTGDWTVRDTVIRNVTGDHGIDAAPSAGEWRVENVTIADVGFVGVAASFSSGGWRIANTTIRESMVGVGAIETSGDWRIERASILNVTPSERYSFMRPPLKEGVGVHATNTNGSWTVRATRFAGNERAAIVATGADPAGDARRNWWGDATDSVDDCVGAVDCDDPLSTWPPTTPTAIQSPTPAQANSTTTTGAKPSTQPTGTPSDATAMATTTSQPTTERPTTSIGSQRTWPVEPMPIVGAIGIVVVVAVGLYRWRDE